MCAAIRVQKDIVLLILLSGKIPTLITCCETIICGDNRTLSPAFPQWVSKRYLFVSKGKYLIFLRTFSRYRRLTIPWLYIGLRPLETKQWDEYHEYDIKSGIQYSQLIMFFFLVFIGLFRVDGVDSVDNYQMHPLYNQKHPCFVCPRNSIISLNDECIKMENPTNCAVRMPMPIIRPCHQKHHRNQAE